MKGLEFVYSKIVKCVKLSRKVSWLLDGSLDLFDETLKWLCLYF